jgi:hypothetical protein
MTGGDMDPIREQMPDDIADLVRDFRGPTFGEELAASQAKVLDNLPKVSLSELTAHMVNEVRKHLRTWVIGHPLAKECCSYLHVPCMLLTKFQLVDWPSLTYEQVKSHVLDEFIAAFKAKCDGVDICTVQHGRSIPYAMLSPCAWDHWDVGDDIATLGGMIHLKWG